MASRERIIKTAEKYVSKGKIEAAIKEYRKLLDKEPDDINTLNRLGDLYARVSKVDEAVRLFVKIADKYTLDGFLLKSIAICKKILKLEPSRFDITEKLADLYHRQGLVNEARNQYQVIADHYLKNDDSASAIHVHVKMAELEPDNPSHHLKLAELYQKEQLLEKAMGEYRLIGDLMVDHGHGEEARPVYLRALELDPSNLTAVADLISHIEGRGDGELADLLRARAKELNPDAAELAGGDPSAGAVVDDGEAADEPVAFELEIDEGPVDQVVEEEQEIEEEDDGVFVLDLDDDSPPPTQVLPPTELEESGPEFEVEDEGLADEGLADEGLADEGLAASEGVAEEESVEIVLDDLDGPQEIEWTLEIEEDIDDGEAVFAEVEILEEPPPPDIEPEIELEPPPDLPPVADLVAEAEVFAKYGLREKALERAQEILGVDPQNLEAQSMRIRLLMEGGRPDEVRGLAREFEQAAREQDQLVLWEKLRGDLAKAGFAVEGEEVAALPAPEKKEPDRISRLLGDLVGEIPSVAAEVEPSPSLAGGLDQALADIASQVLDTGTRKVPEEPPTVAPPPPAEAPPEPEESELVALPPEQALEVEVDQPPPVEELAAAPAATEPEAEPVEVQAAEDSVPPPALEAAAESGVEWLDEEPASADVSMMEGEALFDDEDEFFDLAAELEQELSEADDVPAQAVVTQTEEPSLEEIVEGFKRGVAEHLSQEDYDTHYNLGIAYREMGLLDEAIGEFQLAAKDPAYLVDCCSMLGVSFLEKGLPELAVKWYRKGIEAPNVTDEALLGLLYDMGLVYMAMDDKESARKTFVEVYGMNSTYRDVSAKVEHLGGVS